MDKNINDFTTGGIPKATLMRDYCKCFHSEKVVTYCHYCLEGLDLGGADAKHLADLLFKCDPWSGQ